MKKINWGTGIVIAFVLFISFILGLVYIMSTDAAYEYDLVAEDYYKDELEYQHRIDMLNNAKKLPENVSLQKVENGISIVFPKNIDVKDIQGTIYLYRPSNRVLDKTIPISLDSHTYFIANEILIGGRWDVHVQWSISGKEYLFKNSINY